MNAAMTVGMPVALVYVLVVAVPVMYCTWGCVGTKLVDNVVY
jgi:hypothetical protein